MSISFGHVDVVKLLKSGTSIEETLIDSGEERLVSGTYDFSITNEQIEISPQERPDTVLRMNRIIHLTPRVVAFIGLYLGDGNKTGYIGFSQREINILGFAYDVEREIFGDELRAKWSILEDTKWFEDTAVEKAVVDLIDQTEWLQEVSEGERIARAQKELLVLRFLEKARSIGLAVDRADIRSPTVSPKKGARSSGKSSLEYIQELDRSSPFLPIWIRIVYSVVNSILSGESEHEWIYFGHSPRSSTHQLLMDEYASRVRYWTTKGFKQYTLSEDLEDENRFTIYKTKSSVVSLRQRIPLSPFLFLLSGFYLAEGDTKKEHVFTFDTDLGVEDSEHIQPSLAVALTSSEGRMLQAFIDLLDILGSGLFRKWKVKVGTKYVIETMQLCQKLGVVLLRGGILGQGYVRTQEAHEAFRDWAVEEMDFLEDYLSLYSNVEITGVGIPRVHLSGSATINVLFISLVRDAVFDPASLFMISEEDIS